jgi:hypothetical protein
MNASPNLPSVSVADNGEVVIWPSAGIEGGFARRDAAGVWRFSKPGACVAPTADELKDKFEPVMDSKMAEVLIHAARAALSSA